MNSKNPGDQTAAQQAAAALKRKRNKRRKEKIDALVEKRLKPLLVRMGQMQAELRLVRQPPAFPVPIDATPDAVGEITEVNHETGTVTATAYDREGGA